MRAIFMGTPEIAVASLEALNEIAELVGVICQPDRPAGRGMQLRAPPVKERAQALGLDLLQPMKMKDGAVAAWMRARNPDVALVIAFGRILPRDVLSVPRRGCMNLHASLLPRYRGAAPINWAIANGERETGVCLMQMDEGLDTGPVYAERRLAIGPDETTGELTLRLAGVAAELVRSSLLDAVDGKLVAKPQDHAAATLAPILKKDDGRVDWTRSARALHDHVRAMQPWPGAFTSLPNGKTLKVIRTRPIDAQVSTSVPPAPGVVLVADRGGVVVACGEGGREAIAIVEAQPEGKRAMATPDLVNGRVLVAGALLGSGLREPHAP
jgi:methionyl-tRNA formyltransferase